jgi:hypothetical protein
VLQSLRFANSHLILTVIAVFDLETDGWFKVRCVTQSPVMIDLDVIVDMALQNVISSAS